MKAPWLDRIELKWICSKRAIIEPDWDLTVAELVDRVCDFYGSEWLDPISQ